MPARIALVFALVLAAGAAACSTPDPLYCDEDTPCDDPELPFCDLEGTYPASEGISRTCIAEPSFAISLSDDDAQVRAGGALDLEVTIDRTDAFPGDITVIAADLPDGASADPLTIPDGATTGTLTIQAPDSEPGAIAAVTVTATAGPIERAADLHLLVLGAPGSLDPTFGTLGVAAEPPSATDDATFLAQLPDGSLIVAGASFETDTGALLHFSADGALDDAFGSGGVNRFNVAVAGLESPRLPYRYAQQSDGKIIMAVGSSSGDIALARFNADGQLDPEFAGSGLGVLTISTDAVGVGGLATGPDDEILIAMHLGAADRILLVRYTRDGVRDQSFSSGGLVVDRGTNHSVGDVRVLSNGSVVLAARATDDASMRIPFVSRYTPHGAVDAEFGVGGVVDFAPDITVVRLLEQENGELIVAGTFTDTEATPPNAPVLWRLTSTGEIDEGFANGELKVAGVDGGVSDLLETNDGLIAIAPPGISLIRLDPVTGDLDASFGENGIAVLPLAEGFAQRAVRRGDRRIVVLADDDSFQFVLARFFE